mmetsp:Transcript_11650/g.8511  ORF Transcript_11650/g.8511 Transcript_11650/m.8511 type:complete len:106 (-) Transcript_11650:255-572(-)
MKKALLTVPERYKSFFLQAFKLADLLRDLIKKPDWAVWYKTKEAKLKVRTSERGIQCLKSTALIPASLEEVLGILKDLELKPTYDETFERGHVIADLPMDVTLVY